MKACPASLIVTSSGAQVRSARQNRLVPARVADVRRHELTSADKDVETGALAD